MVDYFNYINIFNLVPTKTSLFKDGDLESNPYVFGLDYSDGFEYEGKISNNIYLTVYNFYKMVMKEAEDEEEYKNLQEISKIYQDNLDKIIECIKENEKDSKKGAFYNISSYYEYNDILYFDCQKVEVEPQNFDDNIIEIFAEATRHNLEGEIVFSLTEIDQYEYFKLLYNDDKFIVEEYDVY